MMAEISFVGYVNNNLPDKALDLFEQSSPEPDDALLSSAFSACAASGDQRAIRLGNKLLRQVQRNEAKGIIVINSAINMLMKFGQVKPAEDFFARVQTPDVAIYGTMMHGYNHNEQPQSSLSLFDRMKQQRLAPNLPLSFALIKAAALIGMRPICETTLEQLPSQHQEDHRSKNALIDMWVSRSVSFW